MNRFKITRRRLLGVAAATGVTGFVLSRDAHVLSDDSALAGVAGTEGSAHASNVNDRTRPTLAWLDGMLTGEDLALANAAVAPLLLGARPTPRVLEPDLVWQWRRGLAQELSNGVRAVAITRWDKALLLSDLAREASLPVRRRRIGHSLFQTEIG